MDIQDCVLKIIRHNFAKDPAMPITVNDRLRQELDMDSLDKAEFLMQIEDFFHVSFPDNTEQKWFAVSDVIASLKEAIPNKKPFND